MIVLDSNKEDKITFDALIEGVSHKNLQGTFNIIIEGIHLGFPIQVYEGRIIAKIPQLNKVIKTVLKENNYVEAHLDIISDGFHVRPWKDTINIKSTKSPLKEIKKIKPVVKVKPIKEVEYPEMKSKKGKDIIVDEDPPEENKKKIVDIIEKKISSNPMNNVLERLYRDITVKERDDKDLKDLDKKIYMKNTESSPVILKETKKEEMKTDIKPIKILSENKSFQKPSEININVIKEMMSFYGMKSESTQNRMIESTKETCDDPDTMYNHIEKMIKGNQSNLTPATPEEFLKMFSPT